METTGEPESALGQAAGGRMTQGTARERTVEGEYLHVTYDGTEEGCLETSEHWICLPLLVCCGSINNNFGRDPFHKFICPFTHLTHIYGTATCGGQCGGL